MSGYNIYGPGLALDRVTMRGLSVQPAIVVDADTGDPVQPLTMDEVPEPLVLTTNAYGYFPQFQTAEEHKHLRVTFGSLTLDMATFSLIYQAAEQAVLAQQAAASAQQAAEQAASLVNSPADTVMRTIINNTASVTRVALNAIYAVKDLATSAKDGLMPKGDKALLDGATASPTVSAIMRRDSTGAVQVLVPATGLNYATNRSFVENLVNAAKLPYKGKLATDAATTYPEGYSEGLFDAPSGWPHPSFSNVVTFRPPGYASGTIQWAYPYISDTSAPMWRVNVAAGWGAWQTLASTDAAAATAAQIAGRASSQSVNAIRRPASGSTPESFLTVFYNGDNVPGAVGRVTGADSASATPPRETLDVMQKRTGASVIINASGWWTLNNYMGLSIKDGVLVQGWESTGDLGNESCVIMRSGELRIYTKAETPNPTTIINEGGYQAFSWGAAVYRNGAVTDFRTKYTRYSILSARQLVGSTTDGHIFILTIPGVTGVSGADGDKMVAAAQATGLKIKHLYVLDGGGSAQTMIDGSYFVPSSDAAPRPVPDALYFRAPVAKREAETPEKPFRYIRIAGTNTVPNGAFTVLNNMSPGPGDFPGAEITLNNGVFTVRDGGVYAINGQVLFSNVATGSRVACIVINAGLARYRVSLPAVSGSTMAVAVSVELGLNANTTIALEAYQTSGNSMNIPTDADGTRLSIRKVS